MLRSSGQHALRRLMQWRRPRAAAQAEGLREALLRDIYDQNRQHAPKPGPPRAARPRSRGRRGWLQRLPIPLTLLAVVPAVLILGGSHLPGWPLPALFSPVAASLGQGLGPDYPPPLPSQARYRALPSAAAPPPLPSPRPKADALPERPSPAPPADTKGGNAAALSEVAPLLSGKENLKSLFGLSVKTIVVDAGHGGHDPGAVGRTGTLEKNVTLDIARRMKTKLEERGAYRVLLVRDGDVFVPLRQRADFANANPTDLFISIHVNFLPGSATNAVEAYYFGRHRDARTRRVAERENRDSDYPLSEFEDLLRNMQNALKLQEAKALAHSIQGSMLARIRAERQAVMDNGVRPAPFVVLLGVKAPAVLVEIGSLSSPEAERNLGREEYREQIASYVAAGIADHLDQQPAKEEPEHGKDEGRLAQRQ